MLPVAGVGETVAVLVQLREVAPAVDADHVVAEGLEGRVDPVDVGAPFGLGDMDVVFPGLFLEDLVLVDAPVERGLEGIGLRGGGHGEQQNGEGSAQKFSTVWKTFFHSMENFSLFFPHHGKNAGKFSTPWKTFFHGMENPTP